MQRILLSLILVGLVLAVPASASNTAGFTTQVSPSAQTNATEPYVAVDRSDGTTYVAWQASGSHVARSDNGGRSFVQVDPVDPVGRDIGDVDIEVGGPTPCTTPATNCLPGTHRVYLSSISRVPPLQVRLAYSDDRGVHWTVNDIATVNPSFVDRPWLAVRPSTTTAAQDDVYVMYHDFTISQIWVASSHNGGGVFVQTDVLTGDPNAEVQSFCNTVPSDIDVDPETGEIYVLWITADPVQNIGEACDISQIQNFHQVYVGHSEDGGLVWDVHQVFDGGPATNTDELFATLAVDDSGQPGVGGTVYAVFPDNLAGANVFDIWFTRSLNKGSTWSQPVKVNSDKGTHYFPWIDAGTTGRVDFIWLNSPDYTPTDAEQSPWYVTFAQTTNGTSATPKFNQTSASSSVMHVGGICTNGIFCSISGGNRDLADSISIEIDRGGSAALVWTDQGRVLHGPTHITYGCNTSQQTAIVGANPGLSCKGPAGPK